jgi:hypothetical protein
MRDPLLSLLFAGDTGGVGIEMDLDVAAGCCSGHGCGCQLKNGGRDAD